MVLKQRWNLNRLVDGRNPAPVDIMNINEQYDKLWGEESRGEVLEKVDKVTTGLA